MYFKECISTFSQQIDHHIYNLPEDDPQMKELYQNTAKYWQIEYDVEYPSIRSSAMGQNWMSLTKEDLKMDLQWFPAFKFLIGEEDPSSDTFLIQQIKNYERFLFLLFKYAPKESDSFEPHIAIQLIWYAHMIFPKAYTNDCNFWLGRIAPHFYLHPQDINFDCHSLIAKLWRFEFKTSMIYIKLDPKALDFVAFFPREITRIIFQELSALELSFAGRVSKGWRVASSDDVLWHKICQQIGLTTLCDISTNLNSNSDNGIVSNLMLDGWKLVYFLQGEAKKQREAISFQRRKKLWLELELGHNTSWKDKWKIRFRY